MPNLLCKSLRRADNSDSLVRDLSRWGAGLILHPERNVLEVRIPTPANCRSNRAIQHLLDHLNAGECTYPGGDFRPTYPLGEPDNGAA